MGRKQNQAESSWRSRMTKFRRSKLTVVEFCRREAVSVPSFYHWRKRLEGGRPRSNGRLRTRKESLEVRGVLWTLQMLKLRALGRSV